MQNNPNRRRAGIIPNFEIMEENLKNKLISGLLGQQKRIENSDNPIDFDRAKTFVSIVNAIVSVHAIDGEIEDTVPKLKKDIIPITQPIKSPVAVIESAPKKPEKKPKIEVEPGFKYCKKCETPKPLDLFYRQSSNKDGYMGACKECHEKSIKEAKAKKNAGTETPKREKKVKPESGKFIGRAQLNAIFKERGWPKPAEFALPVNQKELDDLISTVQTAREISEGMTVKPPKEDAKPVKHEGPRRMEKNRVGDHVKYIHLTGDHRTGVIEAFTDANKVTPKGDYYSFDTAAIKDDKTGTIFDRPLHKIKKIEE